MSADELSGEVLTLDTISTQLAQALGNEKAVDVVATTAVRLGVVGPHVRRQQALDILAEIADEPGIVGVCARFALTRLMLASVSLTNKPWSQP